MSEQHRGTFVPAVLAEPSAEPAGANVIPLHA
jgi:hypothetical protein